MKQVCKVGPVTGVSHLHMCRSYREDVLLTQNVPQVISLTGPKFNLNFSRDSGVFAKRVNTGIPSKIRECHTLTPLYIPCTHQTLNNEINELHERCLKIYYSSKILLFDVLFIKYIPVQKLYAIFKHL